MTLLLRGGASRSTWLGFVPEASSPPSATRRQACFLRYSLVLDPPVYGRKA